VQLDALSPPPPPSRTDWTRLVPPPVLTGHASTSKPKGQTTRAPAGEWTRLQQPPVLLHRPRRHALPRARAPRSRVALGAIFVVVGGRCEVDKSLDCVPIRRELRVRPAPRPPPRTKWTRRVPHPVLIGHVASLRGGRTEASRGAERGRARSQRTNRTRRVRLVREEGRDVSSQYGREGEGGGSAAAVGGAGGT
jgi:hypothetical protein